MPKICDKCGKEFDKKSREAHKEWQVIVRDSENAVLLFCPECLTWLKNQSNKDELVEKYFESRTASKKT